MKNVPEIFKSELGLMEIIWGQNPISMKELVAKGYEVRNWKRTTVYTMVKRLGDRGVVTFKDGIVTALYSRDEVRRDMLNKLYNNFYDNNKELMIEDINLISSKK